MSKRRVRALCVACTAACVLAMPAPAIGQQVGASVFALDPGPWIPEMGRVSIPITCQAFVYIDPYGPMMDFSLWVDLYVDGAVVQSGQQQAHGFGVEVVVHAVAEVALNDVQVSCLAHGSLGAMSDHLTLPKRIPTRVATEVDNFQYFSPGRYLRTRHYRVWDNYDRWYAFSGTQVTESIWTSGQNGCNIQSYTIGQGWVNNVAQFGDDYGTGTGEPLAACLFEAHRDCVTRATQRYEIAGAEFTHAIDWRCDNVVVHR